MAFEYEYWPIAAVVLGAVLTVLFLLYNMRIKEERKKKEKPSELPVEIKKVHPLKIDRIIKEDEAKTAQKDLRTLDLEREILSLAIRRLYEAHSEGKITEEERENLAHRYKSRMMKIKKQISRDETVVALYDLEAMRSDLFKLFSDRFDEVNKKIEEVKSRIDLRPAETALAASPSPPAPSTSTSTPSALSSAKEKRIVRKKPSSRAKTEAEKRIEEITAEVEKVLERLGQIEVEA